MITDQPQPVLSQSSLEPIEDLDISNSILSIMKHKILQQAAKNAICNSQIDISSSVSQPQSSIVQAFIYEEPEDSDQDQQYLPDPDSLQSEIVKKHKKHNLRSTQLKIITKQQFSKPLQPSYHQLIVIEDQEPAVKSFYSHKQQSVKINFKEELRGPITKKTKMEFLSKKKQFYVRRQKTQKIKKAIKKLSKELE